MRNFMLAFLTFMVTVAALYVLEMTLGGAIDGMYFNFVNLTPTLNLPTAWNAVAVKNLTYFSFIWKSVIALIVAVAVWTIRVAFVDQTYERQM